MFKMVYGPMCLVVLIVIILMAAMDTEDSRARSQFQYCLGAAHPASAEAVKACHEAAWPKDRATQEDSTSQTS